MKTKLFIILLVIGYPVVTYANNPVNDFLLAAQADANHPDFIPGKRSEMNIIGSWFENAQFRFNADTPTENTDLRKNTLTYEIRVRPKAWGQRGIEKNIIQLREQQQDNIYQQRLNAALQERYFKLLEYQAFYNKTQHLLKTAALLSQQAKFIRSQVMSDQFNPGKLLDTEDALQQTQEMLELNQVRLNALQDQIGIPRDSLAHLQSRSGFDWMVSVADIQRQTETTNKASPSPPEIENARLKLQLSRSEHQLTQVKQQIGVNLLKFEYSDRRSDSIAFQVGINIPLGTDFDEAEKQYQLHAAKNQLNTSLVATRLALDEISNSIDWLSKDWELVQKQSRRVQKHLQKDYARNNPFLMLDLRMTLLNHEQKKAEIKQKSLALYVNYLALSGQLIQTPLRNWIQQGTPELLPGKMY